MAPGANSRPRNQSRSTIKRLHNLSRPLPLSMLSNMPSTSTNRFSALADLDEMDSDPISNIHEVKQTKPPPLVVDTNTTLTELQNLLGKDAVFKRTSIGTKVFPQSFEKYEFCKKVLQDKKLEFHSFNPKENRLYNIFLYGLPKISTDDIKNDI